VAAGAAAQLAQRGTSMPPTLVIACGALLVAVAVLELPARRAGVPRSEPLAAPPAPGTGVVPTAEPAIVPPGGPDPGHASGSPGAPLVGRRQVLLAGIGLALVATGALVGRATDRVRALVRLPAVARPLPAVTAAQDLAPAVEGLSPVLTPVADFYRIDTALTVPQVDVASWRLRITGRVDREVTLDLDRLVELGLVEVDATIACVSNEVGGGLIGTARWTGVPLTRVLELAGPRADAEQLVGRSVDGWTAGFPLAVLDDGREALVAVGMQGEPLSPRHGAPARLVVPGLYGYVSATKWLTELELTGWESFDAYWVPRGWAKEAPIKPSSRIDVPRDGASVPAGEVEVAGVAWAPTGGVHAVEVRIDDGPWRGATLASPLSAATWVQWRLRVPLAVGTRVLTVRVIDAAGRPQPAGPVPVLPDGAEGHHQRRLLVV
jgi:DMSO/TMAO reductase YedYZ molybdopterin-dependent catalytic subunit